MARHYTVGRLGVLRKRWLLVLVLVSLLAISMLVLLPLSSPFDSCDRRCQIERKARVGSVVVSPGGRDLGNPLGFMKSKLVLLVSQILSLVLLRFRLVGLILKLRIIMKKLKKEEVAEDYYGGELRICDYRCIRRPWKEYRLKRAY